MIERSPLTNDNEDNAYKQLVIDYIVLKNRALTLSQAKIVSASLFKI